MPLSQENRLISVKVAGFGDNDLLLMKFRGQEEFSRLFHFELDMISEDLDIKPADIIGKKVDFTVRNADDEPRFFNGYVSRFITGHHIESGVRSYRAEVVPWLWFLTQTADSRIFQDKSVKDIIEEVFNDCGLKKFRLSLGGYNPRLYCVQYQETDFQFVSRLMEEAGIYYFFEHEEGDHTLVVADATSGYFDLDEDEVEFRVGEHVEDFINSWEHSYEFHPGAWVLTEYDFQNPTTDLEAKSKTKTKLTDAGKYEIFDYPGGLAGKEKAKVSKKGDSSKIDLAQIRLEEYEAEYDVVLSTSGCTTFSPGGKFKLKTDTFEDHPDDGKKFTIRSIEHNASDDTYFTSTGGSRQYSNSFQCIPDDILARPARITPRPFIKGLQTAVVVGPSGEEIYTDEYGRVKVQFPWDREGMKDEKSSCWMRVSQGWAGSNWGILFTPRIGQEVIVDFLEGDPDRPIITGRVYNADQMPPYTLPDDMTQSGIKTRSSLGKDEAKLFNELRFEDKKEKEHIYFHAERDFMRVVENNDELEIGFDWKDPGDRKVKIHNNYELVVGNSDSDDGSQKIDVWMDRKGKIHKGNDLLTVSAGDQKLEVSKGNQEILITAGYGKTKAGKYLELKVGGSSIKIEPAKITIKSTEIIVEGEAKLTGKSPMTEILGDGKLTLMGGIVQIN